MAEHFAELVRDLGADVLGINCGRSLEENLQALKELRAATPAADSGSSPTPGLPGSMRRTTLSMT